MKCILTSASLGKEDDINGPIRFAEQLTGKTTNRNFELIKGTKEERPPERIATLEEIQSLANLNSESFIEYKVNYEDSLNEMQAFFKSMNWPTPPSEHTDFPMYLYNQLDEFGPLETIISRISGQATSLKEIVAMVCPNVEQSLAEKAISNLLLLANAEKKRTSITTSSHTYLFPWVIWHLYMLKFKMYKLS